MIITDKKAIADDGKYLKLGDSLKKEIYLGNNYIEKGGKTVLFNVVNFNDVKEVYPIDINGVAYYISATSYGDIVSELIRQKYTIDQELALYANHSIGTHNEQFEKFQEWRIICKETAKKLINNE